MYDFGQATENMMLAAADLGIGTRLIVGGHDDVVLDLNRRAQRSYGG